MNNITFRHKTPIQLRFNDFDALGHVNNSVYLSFYDIGKTAYVETVLPDIDFTSGIGVVIVDIHVTFLLQIFPGEKVIVETAVTEIGNKSFKLSQQLIDVETKEVKCVAKTVMVCYDTHLKSAIPLPENWKNQIADFEKNNDLLTTA